MKCSSTAAIPTSKKKDLVNLPRASREIKFFSLGLIVRFVNSNAKIYSSMLSKVQHMLHKVYSNQTLVKFLSLDMVSFQTEMYSCLQF